MGQSGRGFPIKAGSLAALERKITEALDTGSHSPADVPKSPLVKTILALPDRDRSRLAVSLCERIAWMQANDVWPGVLWHAHDLLKAILRKKKLVWIAEDVERIAAIAASLGADYYKLPMSDMVVILEGAEPSAKGKRSIKALVKQMLASDDKTHHKLAARLSTHIGI